jgi:tryptophanyl-tRNA synthetase
LRQWVELQDQFEAIYSVVDLHALTVAPSPDDITRRTRRTVAQFLAAGINPDTSILFVQSHVPEHSELTWLLSCLTGFGEASRMTQFKDKSAKGGGEGASVGLFTYPILMAADILIYDAQLVPVGEDQRQHLELSRTLAERLNSRYGAGTAVVPEPYIVQETAKIRSLADPTSKMSKSAEHPGGVLELMDDPKVLAKRIKSAVTDTGSEIIFDAENKPGISNLLLIYSALSGKSVDALESDYAGKGYGHLKVDLAEVVIETFAPIRNRALEYLDDPAQIDAILKSGALRARDIASTVLGRIRDRFGLVPLER